MGAFLDAQGIAFQCIQHRTLAALPKFSILLDEYENKNILTYIVVCGIIIKINFPPGKRLFLLR